MKLLGKLSLILVFIGALNWGLVGFLKLDIVAELLGGRESIFSRIVYSLIGLSAVYILYESFNNKN